MGNRVPFAPDEWYHCYSRGVEKRRVFENTRDYQRFIQTLYLANSTEPIHQDNLRKFSHEEILSQRRGDLLVAVGAYCLMPNHFHLLLKELVDGGITQFMRKVGTAYTMYFNIKNERVGNLFNKPFRSKHINDDRYLKWVPQYLHLNPAELFEQGWKEGKVKNFKSLTQKLRHYPYSSFSDYCGIQRVERSILHEPSVEMLNEDMTPAAKLISKARGYYQELSL